MNKLDELQKLCDEATPEWRVFLDGYFIRAVMDGDHGYGISCKPADAKFIAAARTYMPLLIAVARAAESSPCRHYAEQEGCTVCKALAALEQAK